MDRFRELATFIAVAELGGFAKAATRLNSSPPAVTRIISALEQRLGVELLTRTTRRVHLTELGQLFLERARNLVSDFESAEKEVSGEGGAPSGQLVISASVTMGRSILPPVVSGFLDAHPLMTSRVLLLDRVINLVEEGIDIALRVQALPNSTLMSRRVGEVRRILVASPAYLARRGAPETPADLRLHTVIAFTGLMPNRNWAYHADGAAHRIVLQPRFEINDATAAIAAAEAGDGITIALSYMVSKMIQKGRLAPVLLEYCPPATPVSLVYPESRLVAPKVRAFMDYASPRISVALKNLRPPV